MRSKQIAQICAIVIGLMGCSAHNSFVSQLSPTKYAPHSNPVYVTSSTLPGTAKYEILGQLEVGKRWYGSSRNVLQSLADGARNKLGANAVVEAKTWYRPSGWSWAAPHGSGKAVKITEPASVDFATLGGDWK